LLEALHTADSEVTAHAARTHHAQANITQNNGEPAMAEEIIEVTIRPDGKVEMRVNGIPGMDCLAQTQDLARLLGGEVEAQELTAEAYQDVEQHQQGRLWH
jgi:hypothetical protein